MPTPITASTLSALLSAALAQKPTRPLVPVSYTHLTLPTILLV